MAKVLPIYPSQNDESGPLLYIFHCPGCKCDHGLDVKQHRVGGNPQWSFNGDVEKPTFTPSLLCNPDHPATRCHSFITDGKIQFLDDCYHELKGQTVEIPEYEE